MPVLLGVDAVTVPVPDLDVGLRFYRDVLGQPLRWRNDEIGQAGLGAGGSEIVLTTRQRYEPGWLVEPADIPVGRVAVAADPFGNELVLVDLSRGRYSTDAGGNVTGVQ